MLTSSTIWRWSQLNVLLKDTSAGQMPAVTEFELQPPGARTILIMRSHDAGRLESASLTGRRSLEHEALDNSATGHWLTDGFYFLYFRLIFQQNILLFSSFEAVNVSANDTRSQRNTRGWKLLIAFWQKSNIWIKAKMFSVDHLAKKLQPNLHWTLKASNFQTDKQMDENTINKEHLLKKQFGLTFDVWDFFLN